MAFTKTMVLASGIEVKDAYLKINYVTGNKDLLFVEIKGYLNKKAADEGLEHITVGSYNFAPDNTESSLRWDKQAYEYLKTLPEFSNAVDVLE